MKIKEFEALTLKDCLQQARKELGPDAVILETRKVVKGGLMGWGAKEAVRIVAATGIAVTEPPTRSQVRRPADETPPERADPDDPPESSTGGGTDRRQDPAPRSRDEEPARPPAPAAAPRREALDAETFFAQRAVPAPEPAPDPATQVKLARLEQEMRELRMGMTAMRAVAAQPPAAQPSVLPGLHPMAYPDLYHRLRGADMSEETTLELLNALPDLSVWGPQARAPMAESALRELLAGRIDSAGP